MVVVNEEFYSAINKLIDDVRRHEIDGDVRYLRFQLKHEFIDGWQFISLLKDAYNAYADEGFTSSLDYVMLRSVGKFIESYEQ